MNRNFGRNPVPNGNKIKFPGRFPVIDFLWPALETHRDPVPSGSWVFQKVSWYPKSVSCFLNLFDFQASGRPPTFSYMLAFCLKILFQILFQTLFLYMVLWMTLFHDRWKTLREFMTRTYTKDSVIYLSGFVIITALMVTTFGRGLIGWRLKL